MNKKLKVLRDLGKKIEAREIKDEDVVALAAELDEALAAALDEHTGTLKEDVAKIIEDKVASLVEGLKDAKEGAEEAKKEVDEVAEEVRAALAKLQEREKARGVIRRQLRSVLDKNFEQIRAAYKGGKAVEFQLSLRDAAMMTSDTFALAAGTLAPGTVLSDEVHELRYPENFIIDAIGGRQVQFVNNLVERGVKTEEGAAVVVPEGGLKPMISWTMKTNTYTKRKIAGHIEYTDELREADGERLYNMILDLLERKVLRDYQALTMAWMGANASTYLGSNALSDTMVVPTNMAAFEAAALQLAALGYTPDVLYLNPADMAADKYMQNASGSFINMDRPDMLPMKVYQSYAVPRGKFLVLDSSFIKEEHTAITLKFGRINDQLIKNEETAVAELYQLIHFANGENTSAIYGDIATIKADLQKTQAA